MDRRRLKGRSAYCYNCTTQQNLFRPKKYQEFKNSVIYTPSIDTSRPSRDSESSFMVIAFPSLVY